MYSELYNQKLTSPENAIKAISNGNTVIHGMLIAEPPALLKAMATRISNNELKDINIYTLLAYHYAKNSYLLPELARKINANTWFVSSDDRQFVIDGYSHYVPNNFSQIPKIIEENMTVDVVMTTVSPMDKNGYFTFGTSNDYITTAVRKAKKVILEVNPLMPKVHGDSLIHISEVHSVVENTAELMEYLPGPPLEGSDIIGNRIAEMVPNGATLQFGVGGIPSAVCNALTGHKHLGIHTEVFCPEMINLIRSGAADGSQKVIHPHKHTYTIAQGNRELYDFIDDNVSIESYPVSILNNPAIIAQQPNMISINATLEVDLFGQCNSEFLKNEQFTSPGGQLDFVRGAYYSPGGKSIIAFYSSAKNGTMSRVVPKLKQGGIVTVPRQDVHWLITEYGEVNLKGKNTKERALAIIDLAAPQFRDDLIREAKELSILK